MEDRFKPGFREDLSISRLALLAGVVTLYLASRLYGLLKMPIFIDEAIHIWWARDMHQGLVAAGFAEGRWFSILLMSLALQLPGDALWLVRATAIVAGLATLAAVLAIGRELFSFRVGLLACLFYLFLPYALFYDRLALADSLATPFGAWILYLSIKSVRSRWGGNSVILALLLVLAMLVKISGIAYLIIPPLTVLILLPKEGWKLGVQRIMPAMLAGLLMLGAIYIVGIPTHQVASKAGAFTLGGVLQSIITNSRTLGSWCWYLLAPPLAIFTGLMLLWSILTRPGRPVAYLWLLLLVSLSPYILFAQAWYPRYLTFSLVPLVLLLATFTHRLIDQIAGRVDRRELSLALPVAFLVVLLIWPVGIDLSLLTNPESTPVPEILEWEFKSGWPAGFGTSEAADFLAKEASEQNSGTLIVLQPLFWAHTNRGGLQIHLPQNNNVEFVEFGQDLESELAEVTRQLEAGRRQLLIVDATHPLSAELFVAVQPQLEANLIWTHPKPGNLNGLEVWDVVGLQQANRSPGS